MGQSRHSIRSRFTKSSAVFLCLIAVLSLVSFWRLRDYNSISSEIQNRFLPNTRYLGDINNFTSDFRANEATSLLAVVPKQVDDCLNEEIGLVRRIAEAEAAYLRVPHTPDETALYTRFDKQWRDYRRIADTVIQLAIKNHTAEATKLYISDSLSSYNAASNTLEVMTERNVNAGAIAVQRANQAFYEALVLIGLVAGGGALVSLVNALYIRRSISDPLVSLAASMHRLAANDMDIDTADTARDDEIGEMARALVVFRDNAMELARNQKALAEQASLLEEKLAIEQNMTSAQRNFIAMASHEFRTPLTIIDGYAQRLIRSAEQFTPTDLVERGRKIRAAIVRLTNVIENLLESGRLLDATPDLFFHPGRINLGSLLRDVCKLHREIAPAICIMEYFQDDKLEMNGDAKLLSQAFGNLVSNAIKYSPHGSTLRVSAKRHGNEIWIEIQDKGIGIDERDRENIFTRYFRGSNANGVVGTGVGLFLVKMVVDMHHGRIDVESKIKQGSTFTVILPVDG